MAPKGTKMAKAKAKSAAVVKDALLPKEQQKAQRRRLNRRDTEDQVERVFEEVLTDLTDMERDVVTVNDHTCRQWLSAQKRACKEKDGRLSCGVTTLARSMYKRESSKTSLLVVKDASVSARPEFHRVLTLSCMSNPSQRQRKPLYSYLKFACAINQTEMVGLLRSIIDLNCTSGKANAKHVIEVVKFLHLHSMLAKYADECATCKDLFDTAAANCCNFQCVQPKKKVSVWFNTWKKYFQNFLEVPKVEDILTCESNLEAKSQQIVEVCNSGKLGSMLFVSAQMSIVCGEFYRQVKAVLDGLPAKGIVAASLDETKDELLNIAVEAKHKMGKAAVRLKVDMTYRGVLPVQWEVKDFMSYIDAALNLWLRNYLVGNNGGFSELVFEKDVLSSPKKQSFTLPVYWTSEIESGILAINNLLTEAKVETGKEMLQTLELNWDDLLLQDAQLHINRLILDSLIKHGGLSMLQAKLKSILPTGAKERPVLSKTVDALDGLKESKLYKFVSADIKGKIKATIGVWHSLRKGEISQKSIESYKGFDAEMVPYFDHFLWQEAGAGQNKKLLIGEEALVHKFKTCKSAVMRTAEQVEPLTQFAFKLKPEEQELVKQWQSKFPSSSVVAAAAAAAGGPSKKAKKPSASESKTDLQMTHEMVSNLFV